MVITCSKVRESEETPLKMLGLGLIQLQREDHPACKSDWSYRKNKLYVPEDQVNLKLVFCAYQQETFSHIYICDIECK